MKWELFRERRTEIVDQYIAARNRQGRAHLLSITITSHHILKKAAKAYMSYKTEVTRKAKMTFAIFHVAFKFKRWFLRPFGGLKSKQLSYCRQALTFTASLIVPAQQKRTARRLLLPFLKEAAYRRNIRELFLLFYQRCMFMQKRLRACIAMNEAKLSVLTYYWGK